jgi:hypothetical protein
MTRREARAIASEEGFVFFEDDGTAPLPEQAEEARSGLDVAGINRKLRAAGVTESELRVEQRPGREDVKVWGTRLQSLPELMRDSDSPFRTAMVSMWPDKLLEALDELVPGWRSGE